MMGAPPSFDGAANVIVACVFLGVDANICGAVGAVISEKVAVMLVLPVRLTMHASLPLQLPLDQPER